MATFQRRPNVQLPGNPAVFRSISIDTIFEQKHSSWTSQKIFSNKPSHLRRTWDLCIRAFDKGHLCNMAKFFSKICHLCIFLYLPNNENRAWATASMDAPQRELFMCDLGSGAALSVPWQIICVCVCFWRPIQLYSSHRQHHQKHVAMKVLLLIGYTWSCLTVKKLFCVIIGYHHLLHKCLWLAKLCILWSSELCHYKSLHSSPRPTVACRATMIIA